MQLDGRSCICFALALVALPGTELAAQCPVEVQRLVAPDAGVGDALGYRVAIAGDVLVTGAVYDDDLGADAGSAYVWARDAGGSWQLAKKLLASDGAAGDFFGYAVEVDGDGVLVGAPRKSTTAGTGAVYVFARDQGGAGNWGEVARLDPAAGGVGATFGYAIDASGDRLLVGAPFDNQNLPGAAYLYQRDGSSPGGWGLVRELASADPGRAFNFGHSVALAGDSAFVSGSPFPFFSPTYVVHVFERDAGGPDQWGETGTIDPPQPSGADFFAERIAADGVRVCASAPGELDFEAGIYGVAYLFERRGASEWGLVRRLQAATDLGAFYAEEVALSGDWLVAGMPYEPADGESDAGAVYVYGRNVGGPDEWGEIAELQASDAHDDGYFGLAMAIDGSDLVVGAPDEYFAGQTAGATYVLDLERLARATWRGGQRSRNPASYAMGRPLVGTTVVASVDLSTTGHALALLIGYDTPGEVVLHGGQVLLVADGGSGELLQLGAQPGPLASFSIDIPNEPALCGFQLATQAGHFGGGAPFALSNAQDLVLGIE
jgi:hypothetical protein